MPKKPIVKILVYTFWIHGFTQPILWAIPNFNNNGSQFSDFIPKMQMPVFNLHWVTVSTWNTYFFEILKPNERENHNLFKHLYKMCSIISKGGKRQSFLKYSFGLQNQTFGVCFHWKRVIYQCIHLANTIIQAITERNVCAKF